jgi:hypothetical protein
MLKLVKMPNWHRNVLKCGKYSPAKFANYALICITRGKMHPDIWDESGVFSRAQYKLVTKFANLAWLYFPHFKTFRNQTLQFY